MQRLVAAAVLLISAACSSGELPECPAGTRLNEGSCRTLCADDEECTASERCASGVCVPFAGVSDAGVIDVGIITCTRDQDCPNGPSGPWSDCVFEGPCDNSGVRGRASRRGSCSPQGLCGINEGTQNMACPRNTDGEPCGDPMFGEWSECAAAEECAVDGTMTREVFTPICSMGACEMPRDLEQRACILDTEGQSCGQGVVEGPWGPCIFPDPCATTGMRSRSVETHVCTNGGCGVIHGMEVDFQTCMQPQAPDGSQCGVDQQCCAGTCVARSDPANCNVCGLTCAPGQQCNSFAASDTSTQWGCGCAEGADCVGGYGQNSDCVSIGSFNVCVCQCPGGDCTGECFAGLCHTPPGLSYCGY